MLWWWASYSSNVLVLASSTTIMYIRIISCQWSSTDSSLFLLFFPLFFFSSAFNFFLLLFRSFFVTVLISLASSFLLCVFFALVAAAAAAAYLCDFTYKWFWTKFYLYVLSSVCSPFILQSLLLLCSVVLAQFASTPLHFACTAPISFNPLIQLHFAINHFRSHSFACSSSILKKKSSRVPFIIQMVKEQQRMLN